MVKLFRVHESGGVNVVDKAIVVVGCPGWENVDALATVSETCRSRSLLCAMVHELFRVILTFDVDQLRIRPLRLQNEDLTAGRPKTVGLLGELRKQSSGATGTFYSQKTTTWYVHLGSTGINFSPLIIPGTAAGR